MKNIIVKTLLLFSLLTNYTCAIAQSDSFAGLKIENNSVSGIAEASFASLTQHETTGQIKVDFPLPPSAYPAEILTVGERYVSKKQMQIALKAAGQSTQGRFVNPRGSASYTGDWNAKASADISADAAAAQGIEIAMKYFEELGVEVDPVPYSISRPYDYKTYIEQQLCYYEHCFSDVTTFIENARASWKRREKYLPKQSEYTSLSFYILLNGMRMNSFTSYPAGYEDEPDAWIGLPVSADVTVSDSGILVEASCPLYEIKKKRPLENDQSYIKFLQVLDTQHDDVIAGDNWMDALSVYLNNLRYNPYRAEQQYQSQYLTEPITQYGSRTVITEIHPVLHTISEREWAPFWKIEVKEEFSDGWRN